MVPLPSWWQKLELNDLSISELFEDLLSWNLESKLITPKYITGTYFAAIMAIFNFSFSVCFLCVMFFLSPERTPKAGPATCFLYKISLEYEWKIIGHSLGQTLLRLEWRHPWLEQIQTQIYIYNISIRLDFTKSSIKTMLSNELVTSYICEVSTLSLLPFWNGEGTWVSLGVVNYFCDYWLCFWPYLSHLSSQYFETYIFWGISNIKTKYEI